MITELPGRIDRVLINSNVLTRSSELLKPSRMSQIEGCLLWYGYVLDTETCLVTTCVRPTQDGQATTYDISAKSMREVRRQVRPHHLLLIIQIHSHPARAFFSTWDEEHALNSRAGALNMIIPYYGNARWIDTKRFCMVERNEHDQWIRWSSRDWDRLIAVPDALGFS